MEWRNVMYSNKTRICLQHHDGHIRVWRVYEERNTEAFIRYRCTDP